MSQLNSDPTRGLHSVPSNGLQTTAKDQAADLENSAAAPLAFSTGGQCPVGTLWGLEKNTVLNQPIYDFTKLDKRNNKV